MDKNCIPYGSDVSAGKFKCRDCGEIITMASKKSLPPCPNYKPLTHPKKCWKNISGQGDAPDDPYPNR
ncbi:MAG: hypothetical protein QNK23_08065 [Crocinitomicaceae bacterium]|nr:hypothetical protein [Crocinitomicaceae bacterium]